MATVIFTGCSSSAAPAPEPSAAASSGASGSSDSTSSDSSSSDSSGSPAPSRQIRDFDFGNQQWEITDLDVDVTLKDGVSVVENGEYAVAASDAPVVPERFGDLDQDGDEDAVVILRYDLGTDSLRYLTVWFWDQQAKTAVQSPRSLARDARCDGFIDSVTFDQEKGLVVDRTSRRSFLDACGAESPVIVRRTFGVKDGAQLQLTPFPSLPGDCPERASNPLSSDPPEAIYAQASNEPIQPILDADQVTSWGMSNEVSPGGWSFVWFTPMIPPALKEEFVGCGYAGTGEEGDDE